MLNRIKIWIKARMDSFLSKHGYFTIDTIDKHTLALQATVDNDTILLGNLKQQIDSLVELAGLYKGQQT